MSVPQSNELEFPSVEKDLAMDAKELEIAMLKERLAFLEMQLRASEEAKKATGVVSTSNTPINSVPISAEMFDHVPAVHNSGGSSDKDLSIQDASFCGSADLFLFSEGEDPVTMSASSVNPADFTTPADDSLTIASPSKTVVNKFYDDSSSSRYASLSGANTVAPPLPSDWIINRSAKEVSKAASAASVAKKPVDSRADSKKHSTASSAKLGTSNSSGVDERTANSGRRSERSAKTSVSYGKFFGDISEDSSDEEYKVSHQNRANSRNAAAEVDDREDGAYHHSNIKHFLLSNKKPPVVSNGVSSSSASAPARASAALFRAPQTSTSAAGQLAPPTTAPAKKPTGSYSIVAALKAVPLSSASVSSSQPQPSADVIATPSKRVSKPTVIFSPVHDPLNSKTYTSGSPATATTTSAAAAIANANANANANAGPSLKADAKVSPPRPQMKSRKETSPVRARPTTTGSSGSSSSSGAAAAMMPVLSTRSNLGGSSSGSAGVGGNSKKAAESAEKKRKASSAGGGSLITTTPAKKARTDTASSASKSTKKSTSPPSSKDASEAASANSRSLGSGAKCTTGGLSGRVCDSKTVVQSGNSYKVIDEFYSCANVWKSREKITTVEWQRNVTAMHCKADNFRTIYGTNLGIIQSPNSSVDALMDALLYMTRILDAHEPPMRVVDSSRLLHALLRLVLDDTECVDALNQALTIIYYIANLEIGQVERINEIVSSGAIARLTELVATSKHYITIENSICLLNSIALGPHKGEVFSDDLQYNTMDTVLRVVKPDSCVEVLYQGLKIIRTFCSSPYLLFVVEDLVLILDLIHAAFKGQDSDMFGFAADALTKLIDNENNPERSNGQKDNLLAGLTEEKGILHTITGIMNDVQRKNQLRKGLCCRVFVACLESISPEMYPHVLRLFKPLPGLISCTRTLNHDGKTTDLNYNACKCLSLLAPHCKNFRIYLNEEEKFIQLMKNIYECAHREDMQEFARIILGALGISVSSTSTTAITSSSSSSSSIVHI